ncbi:MAG TPA: OmpA family protein [Gemmatimonadaceae bacterium]|nr:OmpA family protein [Gemmatimonadaceae bacterium]
MRRLLTSSLTLLLSASLPHLASGQSVYSSDASLAGTRELGIFASGRILSTEYSTDEGKLAYGGALTFSTHLKSTIAFQAGVSGNYSRQEFSYYKPPLLTFTPTISLILQRPTTASLQPYAVVGAGYEFIHYTHPRCDCDQSRSLGVANLGVGMRKMTSGRRALRFEVTSQIGKGGPAFTAFAGMSWFLGTRDQFKTMRPPTRVKPEPPVIIPKQTISNSAPPAAAPPPAPVPGPTPSNTVTRTIQPSPLPAGIGTVLLKFDGTQVDFSRPTWRDEAETMLDGLVVDLVSDAGQSVKISIEAHTDNIGSNVGNIMLGLDRARAIRDYFVSQGVAADRIRISSEGEDAPVAPNTTAIGRQQNRRIIIKRDN